MQNRYRFICFWIALTMILTLAACQSPPSAKPVIKLVANPWVASELNVTVAKILLEEKMGYKVEIVPLDGNAQWDALAKGQAHASLEVWSSGHSQNIQKYIWDQKTVENGGELGPVGKIGWYVPTYLIKKYPELATWEGFKNPEVVAAFKTAASGDKGQFLSGDPSWVQYDKDIIRNLGLNLQVVQLDSEEALLKALDAAYKNQEPILMYFWTPHWAYAIYDLQPVKLPPNTADCYAKIKTGGVDCDYPADPLFKIFWPGLKTYAPSAYRFLRNMHYTNRDQIAMMAMVQLDKKSTTEAARAWIKDNEATWKGWISK